MTKSELIKNLVKELNRSLVVKQSDRNYWLKNCTLLPKSAVEFFYLDLKKTNQEVDQYILAGLESSPELVSQLKQKFKKVKAAYFKESEKEESDLENPEAALESQLKNL